ncbi:hypothetical protein [Hyphomicrobium sp.]|uniref:hypothetical protein n=1 Tax=Hyphomicrobium sp. TaxID=82 RepID=UPI0025C1C868|nr:hypothetical protein [Hyphomicrobium sp.]MCC7252930.1 hypothetical protein [Hyphomicrobium sp.]
MTREARVWAARRYAAVATAVLLVAAVSRAPVATAETKDQSASCEDAFGVSVLASPIGPWKGTPLRVVFTTEKPVEGELSLVAPDGSVAVTSAARHGGPPYFWSAEIAAPAAGKWSAKLARAGAAGECSTLTHEIAVARKKPPGPAGSSKSIWPVRGAWSLANENLYSAWIEMLFDAPLEEAPSWPALHDVLRDRSRNILFNHLGLREDEKGLIIRPDCADLPYTLRAYFAFKMGLPFGYGKCTRGGGGKPPRCTQWWDIENQEPPPAPPAEQQVAAEGGLFSLFGAPPASPSVARLPQKPKGLVPGFGYYIRTTVANGVHSGNGRTMAADENTDYYPVPLKAETLRPGTVYADPYGHILVLAKRVAQTDGAAGVLLAVDGQPDGTIARKRFWRGNFLFAQAPALGSPGFKRFRPVVRGKGGLRRLANAEIGKHAEYGDFSLDQAELAIEDFYDRMDEVMSPSPLDPERELTEALTALEEQVKARVTSVENGRKYQAGGGAEVAMPDGASIFETTGAWEDFATPSRDLRLLIAIDVVRTFPDRVARRPERYAMPQGKSAADVKAGLESRLASELATRKFAYTRSDGSEWSLTLEDVLERIGALEMAYNLNDCVELRWGAPEGSEEAATCKRRAPDAQRVKMSEYRAWFNERRRPPRG